MTATNRRRRRFALRTTPALLATALVASLLPGAVLASASADTPVLTETFEAGTAGWSAVGGGPVTAWTGASDADNTWIEVDNLTGSAGSYIRPTQPLDLPRDSEVTFQVRVDALGANGNVSLVAGVPQNATRIQDGGTSLQVYGDGTVRVQRPVTANLCTGAAPIALGAQSTVTIQRWGDLMRIIVDGEQVSSHTAPAIAGAGETIAIGAYRADARISSVTATTLDAEPAEFPDAPSGCDWVSPRDISPVLVNQSGYDLGQPKRFTAPQALDGSEFEVVDPAGATVASGTVAGGVGDFSDLDPTSEGPYTVRVHTPDGTGESYPFGIGASWTTRVTYDVALRFMAGSMCWFGDFSQVGTGQLRSENTGPELCRKAVAWRDAAHYGFELSSLADLLSSNPEIVLQVPGQPDLLTNTPDVLPADTPLVAQLLYWGAEVFVAEQVNEPQLKGELARFCEVYPLTQEWIPRSTYDKACTYAFDHWTDTERDRFVWQAYTPNYDGNLLGTYTAVGTGKGELVPGFSIPANLAMHQVALRDGREDAALYLDAAVDQASWLAENLDLDDPATTKGQRQSEWVTVTGLVRLANEHPESTPSSVTAFLQEWADVAVRRSENLWDFRRYDDPTTADARWTIPAFTGGGQGEDPNEAGNVAGFAAPALAVAELLGPDDPRSTRLAELAHAHVDNIFGRNPVNRAAQYRVNDPDRSYEGLDRGWFAEYQGGYGILQGLPGVLDGSPKNDHYPFDPTLGNIGHTEGWVNINTAFNASIAWFGTTTRSVAIDVDPEAGAADLTVTGPYEISRWDDVERTISVSVADAAATAVALAPADGGTYTASVPLGDAEIGETVTVTTGAGSFTRTTTHVLTAADLPGGSETEPTAPIVDIANAPAKVPAGTAVPLRGTADPGSAGFKDDRALAYAELQDLSSGRPVKVVGQDVPVATDGTWATTLTTAGLTPGTRYQVKVSIASVSAGRDSQVAPLTISEATRPAVSIDAPVGVAVGTPVTVTGDAFAGSTGFKENRAVVYAELQDTRTGRPAKVVGSQVAVAADGSFTAQLPTDRLVAGVTYVVKVSASSVSGGNGSTIATVPLH